MRTKINTALCTLLICFSLSALLAGVAYSQIKDTIAMNKYYYNKGTINVGYIYQPSPRLFFYGTSETGKPQMEISFGDTIYIKTNVPIDAAGKLIVDWTNKYYDWYVDSLKNEIAKLKKKKLATSR